MEEKETNQYVYVVTHHYGSFDSAGSYIVGVYRNPIDAETEKRKMLDYVNEIKSSAPKYDFDSDEYWSYYIKHEKEMETSDVIVKEWILK